MSHPLSRTDEKPLTTAVVGGFPEPDGTQPMSAAEFRMVREALGLTTDWIAAHLNIALRTVRRWEHGHSPIPDGVRVEMENLEATWADEVNRIIGELENATDLVLTIPQHDAAMPAAWWRSIAHRAASIIPGVHVRYPADDTSQG